jgi:NADH dehydrogenase FAD-containing subunit
MSVSLGINIILNGRVLEVNSDNIKFQVKDLETKEVQEDTMRVGMCVWAAGTATRPIIQKFASKISPYQENHVKKTGRLAVDQYMRLINTLDHPNDKKLGSKSIFSNVFALGDCAANMDIFNPNNTITLPQTAQVAAQQGSYAARLLNRQYNLTTAVPSMTFDQHIFKDPVCDAIKKVISLRGQIKAKPFHFLNLGLLAYVGDSQAVAQIQLGDSEFLKTAGEKAFLLWKSVYLVKQVSTRTRMLVLFDYLKTKFFGRDVTEI